jgi:beta-lactamase class C
MRYRPLRHMAAMLVSACAVVSAAHAADSQIRDVVDKVIRPLMQQHGVPGMAVGIITPDGHQVFDYGVASRSTRKPVTGDTLFEVGSVSKTFTATLASCAQIKGHLSLTDSASRFLPALAGTNLEKVSLLNLGTHTSGGMPLQFPDAVTNTEQMMAYFRDWTPAYAPGSYRTYANPSIGLLGVITAKAMKEDFVTLMRGTLYPALGLKNTYLEVPQVESGNYAQGYTRKDEPIRMTSGVLDAEAYGVRTTAGDMVRFIEANMGRIDLDDDVRKAVTATHTGYYRVGAMTQDLIWEQYAYPVDLDDLLAGNSAEVSQKPNAATEITPPLSPREDVWINKTGSTNGFGAYVAFVPEKKLGIVLLANKNYPVDARVTAAHQILTKLGDAAQPGN